MVVRIRPGFFRGEQTLSITLQDFQRSGLAAAGESVGRAVAVIDCRAAPAPEDRLAEIAAERAEAQVWSEGIPHPGAKPRAELKPGETLVVWSSPPGQAEVAGVLARVKPEQVYVFAKDPGVDTYEAFTRRLGGLVRYAIAEYDGCSSIAELAGAMAHSERTVACGLGVLPAMGVRAKREEGGTVRFERCVVADVSGCAQRLRVLLDEARTFRKFFRTTGDVAGFFTEGG